jgi:glycosyltransferase 2 family protein
VAAWLVAKLVKSMVERGRPRQYLPGINVRDAATTGFGYPSGHSAVAAATAVMIMAALPARWRPLAAVLALLVGVSRIVVGVHFPADVVGGWALGTLVALAVVMAVQWITPSNSHSVEMR